MTIHIQVYKKILVITLSYLFYFSEIHILYDFDIIKLSCIQNGIPTRWGKAVKGNKKTRNGRLTNELPSWHHHQLALAKPIDIYMAMCHLFTRHSMRLPVRSRMQPNNFVVPFNLHVMKLKPKISKYVYGWTSSFHCPSFTHFFCSSFFIFGWGTCNLDQWT